MRSRLIKNNTMGCNCDNCKCIKKREIVLVEGNDELFQVVKASNKTFTLIDADGELHEYPKPRVQKASVAPETITSFAGEKLGR